MDNLATYQAKLTAPENAVSSIRSGSIISMGMAMSEPPALLRALAERVEASELSDIRLYYFESTKTAGDTILRYELLDRVKPYCLFLSRIEREVIKRSD
jgi:itaconate CoA-transferase